MRLNYIDNIDCLRTGRNFIGFELDEKYYEIAQSRIAGEADRLLEDAI